MKVLLVIDMQNDFIDGALGTAEAIDIVDPVVDKVKNFDGKVLFTRDTHQKNYMETEEGKHLPVPHCIEKTDGWQITDKLLPYIKEEPFNKVTFGSVELESYMKDLAAKENIESITLIGLCTDICVISNALLMKANFPNIPIYVEEKLCAGVVPESHNRAIEAMKMCQIDII
ncbi:MAG: cysteine hydrolase family protein [Pleomorphochaeta sp.]